MFEKLFSPIKIRGVELRNRVVMSAMGTLECHVSEDGYTMTDKLVKYHAVRAAGGCGLNTLEVCSVYTPAAPHGYPSIAEDQYIPGLKKLCDAIHAEGGHAAVQLWCGAVRTEFSNISTITACLAPSKSPAIESMPLPVPKSSILSPPCICFSRSSITRRVV